LTPSPQRPEERKELTRRISGKELVDVDVAWNLCAEVGRELEPGTRYRLVEECRSDDMVRSQAWDFLGDSTQPIHVELRNDPCFNITKRQRYRDGEPYFLRPGRPVRQPREGMSAAGAEFLDKSRREAPGTRDCLIGELRELPT
jgi:hypothetical protein